MARGILNTIFPTPKYLTMPAIGIDISDRAIKYVGLNFGKHVRLSHYGEERIAPGVVQGGEIKDAEALIEALGVVRNKTGMAFAHFSLPEEKAYVVDVEVPTLNPGDIRDALALHLDEYVPLEPTTTIFDFDVVHWPNDNEHSFEVALSSIESAFAESYSQVALTAGFVPLSFELESQALARALVKEASLGNTMIIDVGREQSNISVVSDSGIVFLASSLDIGGNAFTKSIQNDLSITNEEARRLKEEVGFSPRNERGVQSSITKVAANLRDEIYRRFNFWTARSSRQGHQQSIKNILLSGGNAAIPGFASYLSTGINVPINIGNPWTNITDFSDYIPEIPSEQALKYGTCLGLALRTRSLGSLIMNDNLAKV